jgi:hypothetical protein
MRGLIYDTLGERGQTMESFRKAMRSSNILGIFFKRDVASALEELGYKSL